MSGVITASQPSWIAPFSGLSPRQFGKLITALRREGADPVRKGRPWSLPLEDRVLLVAAYWRTNLTLRQLAPLFGVPKSAADRIIDHLGPSLALRQRRRFRKDTVLIVDGTLVPTRDHSAAERSKNYRYSTNHQVVINTDTRQLAGRCVFIRTGPFLLNAEWRSLIACMENTIRLHRHEPNTVVKMAKNLHQRTGGMIGSLSHLIRAAAI